MFSRIGDDFNIKKINISRNEVMTNTSITTSIDYEKNGKQISYLGVPISTDESAYGTITLPIT